VVLPAEYALYAFFVALPFAVIGCVSGWQQLRAPSAERVAARLEELRALSWEGCGPAIEEAFRRQGYEVARSTLAGVDFELVKSGRVTLVSARRWKVARAGVEPLRELEAALRAREAQDCVYVAAGEVTGNATAYAAQNGIRLLQGAELVELLRGSKAK
jgi:restriction system protein